MSISHKMSKCEFLFFLAYGIYLFALYIPRMSFYGVNEFSEGLIQGLRYLSYIILLADMIYQRINLKKLIIFIIIVALLAYTLRVSDKTVVFGIIFAFCARNIDVKKILKFSYKYVLYQFILVVLLSIVGVIPNKVSLMDDGRIRYALGFGHPNNAALYFCIIIILFCVINWQKSGKKKSIPIIVISSLLIYYFTQSRTGALICILTILAFTFDRVISNGLEKIRVLRLLTISLPTIFGLFNYMMCSNRFTTTIISYMATKVTGRFYFASKAFQIYGVKLLGQSVTWNYTLGQDYLVVDSSYIRNMIEYGWIAFGVCVFAYTYVLIKVLKQKQYGITIGIVMMLIYSNMEIILLAFGINPFLVLFGSILFGTNKEKHTV